MLSELERKYSVHTPVIGGIKQAVITGENNKDLPVVLLVHGGPGEAIIPFMEDFKGFDEYFTVCSWDQRGAGASYVKNAPEETMTVDRLAEDTVEVSRWMLEYYGRNKLWIMGFSWGTLISILAVEKAPELYSGYIGVGQIADQLRSEQLAYDFALEKAKQAGDAKSIKTLNEVGRPPFTDGGMKTMMLERKVLAKYNEGPKRDVNLGAFFKKVLVCPFYSVKDKANFVKGMFGGSKLFAEVMTINLIEQKLELQVPVYVCQGKFDLQTMPQVAQELIDSISAPEKAFHLFEKSGHIPPEDDLELFVETLKSFPGIDEPCLK